MNLLFAIQRSGIWRLIRPTINKKIGLIFLVFLLVGGANVFVVQKMQRHLHTVASMVNSFDMERRISHTNKIVYTLLGVDGLLLIIGLLAIRRRMVVPLIHISRAAELLARGERFVHVDCKSFDEIGDLARIFNHMVEEIRKLEYLKEGFISTVSHELRTPLSILKMGIDNLNNGVGGPLTEKQKNIFLRIGRNADRLSKIVENILKLSRLESGLEKIAKTRGDTARIITDVLTSFEEKAQADQIRLCGNSEKNLPSFLGDEGMISEVIFNLTDNALRYAKSKVIIKATTNDSFLKISVIDDGPGIPPEIRGNLFNKYEQVQKRENLRGYKGSGLGLSICKKIVDLHGGRIWEEPRPEEGAAFHFTLPEHEPCLGERRKNETEANNSYC